MKDKIQKINRRFPRKVSSVVKHLKNMKISFYILLRSIKLRYPSRFIKYQLINLLNCYLIYPIIRLALGSEKALTIHNFFGTVFDSSSLPGDQSENLPSPFRSKIILPKFIAYYMLYLDIYLADIYCMETLEKEMNVVDIGASIGVYTVLASEKVGGEGKVVAIEPEPKNYRQLIKNIKMNNFQNVILARLALSDYCGSGKLYLHSFGDPSLVFKEDKNSYIKVKVKTLDNLLEELDLKRIDIIKIDAEGSEIPILKGAEKTLKANPNIKIIVAAEHYPSEIEEVCQFLNDRGFKTKVSYGSTVMTI